MKLGKENRVMKSAKSSIFCLFFLCSLLIVYACGSDSGDDNKNVPNEVEHSADGTELKVSLTTREAYEGGLNTIQIVLLGQDARRPEDEPVPVAEYFDDGNIPHEIPFETSIRIDSDADAKVCGEKTDCVPEYYWMAQIDTNGDGQICDGDLIQDDEISPIVSYSYEEVTTENSFELTLKIRTEEDGDCHDIYYYQRLVGLYSLPVRVSYDPQTISDTADAIVYIVLFGMDESQADVSPLPIVQAVGYVNEQGLLETDVDLIDEPAPYVCEEYDENAPCPDRYFFAAYVDVDGDGQICNGDLALDHFERYTLEELTLSVHDYYLDVIDDSDTDCFAPSDPPRPIFW